MARSGLEAGFRNSMSASHREGRWSSFHLKHRPWKDLRAPESSPVFVPAEKTFPADIAPGRHRRGAETARLRKRRD